MSHSTELSDAKRALLEKFLRGELPKTPMPSTVITPHITEGPAPLSLGQQQIWLLAQLIGDAPVYNESVTVYLPGPLDVAVLEQSFNTLLRRHEAWRTYFPMIDGEPVQAVQPSLSFTLPVVDLRDLPRAEREARARRLATEDAKPPFDLVHGPLLRPLLVQVDDEEHRLFLTLHHIIFDGVTIYQIFLPELRALYEALKAGRSGRPATVPQLPELPIQYTDFAAWQREWLHGEEYTDQLAYWKQHLEGAPTTLELPTDRPRPPIPSYRGTIHQLTLSRQLTTALRTLSIKEGATLYMTLMAAFTMLLHRYSGQDEILVGTAAGGRKHAEVQKLMGVFINTIVMRTNPGRNRSFRELLRQVREETLEAHARPNVPFEYLVKELQPTRERGQNPLFQALLMLEPQQPALSSGWTITHMDVDTGTSKFDLSLIIEDRPEGLICRFEYSTDLFDAATIARMAGHWQTLLEGIVAHPGQSVAELPLLTEAERQQILVEWNATAAAYPQDRCVHQLFEEQVERTPMAWALILEERQMTYRTLNAQANQLAHHLRRLGVGPEVLVGLCMDRSMSMVVGLLGILKAGGAYVPMDPAYPAERLAFMLEDTQASVLLTQERYIDLLPAQGVQVMCLDTGWEAIAQESSENLDNRTSIDNLAYVMYTSGSTGKPKGAEIRHRSINRLVFGVDYARLDETRVMLHMAPISFDAATFEVWGALLHGARCVLFPERIPTPKSIGAIVHTQKVTTAWLTASLFNAVIDEAPESLQGIEQVLTGGEALSVVHIRRALELLPTTQLINGYGPTESTTFTCCHPIPRQLNEHVRSIPIGRPIGNTQVYVLDRSMQPVPVGIAGELYIGGDGLARGYFKRPELTNERFVAHPWSSDPEARLYKTGDLVRYLPDGTIDFLGRLDSQVKVRGFRIEPGEIEAILSQHPTVREALVLAQTHERGEKYLVAYVVAAQEEKISFSELRHFLKERLPEYMVPSNFVQLEAMPITPNGKLDTRALPKPEARERACEESYIAPTNAVQQQLVHIWEDLLNVRPIGIRDNFFTLGGHSLLAARLVDRIEQISGKKLPLATLFAGATIEHLAHVILSGEEIVSNSRTSVVVVQAKGSRRPFFFLHGDWAGGGFYCMDLSRYLGPDQPFYILEPYKFEGLKIAPSFEEMARAHIESLRAVQPEGPYLIGGFCNGGMMAYEIARQLSEEGQKVELLALVDPANAAPHKMVRQTITRVGKLLGLGPEKHLDLFLWYIYMRIPAYRGKVKKTMHAKDGEQATSKHSQSKGNSPLAKLKDLFPPSEALRYQWSGFYRWVAAGYMSGPYPGKAIVFWSSEVSSQSEGWAKTSAVKELEVQIIPGTHKEWKSENLKALAGRLTEYLDKLQEDVAKE